MALVTTCPHCGTSFRIVADQLKLRGGLVRCGSCLAVFSGLEKMTRVDDAKTGESRAEPTGTATAAQTGVDSSDPGAAWDDDGPLPGHSERRTRLPDLPAPEDLPSFGVPASSDGSPRFSESERAAFEQAKLERAIRLRDDRPASHHDADADADADADIDNAGGEPVTLAATVDPSRTGTDAERARTERNAIDADLDAIDPDAIDADAIDAEVAIGDEEMAIDYFSADERRRGFLGQHALLKLAAVGVLVLAMIVQAVLANRDWLAARLPALEPAIAAISAPFGLRIAPPRTIGALSIESFELQTDAASELLAVSAIIHNGARHPVRWPSMMLTLTDTQNRVLVRKAIDPADYLSASTDVALRPNSERPIRLALEARDIRPAGYSVVLFYR
ncbi:MAG TPA: DUF3426 domain-containing protein [Burkholderiaceae bacterium]|nr:DUF3426 domain-containing protein [Burkholderiaceae bacterium]